MSTDTPSPTVTNCPICDNTGRVQDGVCCFSGPRYRTCSCQAGAAWIAAANAQAPVPTPSPTGAEVTPEQARKIAAMGCDIWSDALRSLAAQVERLQKEMASDAEVHAACVATEKSAIAQMEKVMAERDALRTRLAEAERLARLDREVAYQWRDQLREAEARAMAAEKQSEIARALGHRWRQSQSRADNHYGNALLMEMGPAAQPPAEPGGAS